MNRTITSSQTREEAIGEKTFEDFQLTRPEEPDWLKSHRKDSWELFQETEEPNGKLESWRFGDPRLFSQEKCKPSLCEITEADAEGLRKASDALISGTRIILANDQCVEEASLQEELESKGLVFESLASAFRKRPEALRRHLAKPHIDLGLKKQAALNEAFTRNGAFLRIPAGLRLKKPLLIYHWIQGENIATFPRTIIEAEKDTEATLVEVFLSTDSSSKGFVCSKSSVEASSSSKVTRVAIQNLNLKTTACLMDYMEGASHSQATNYTILIGANACRHETSLRACEPESELKARSIVAASGDQLFDQRSRQDHAAKYTTTDILTKNALLDRSRSIFGGLIRVEESAQQANAYQTNRNLLVGASAEANSLPGLEILANDVKCSHGATTGRIDEEQMFYLQSRGIPSGMAQQLLTLGFLEEAISDMPPLLSEWIQDLLQNKFS